MKSFILFDLTFTYEGLRCKFWRNEAIWSVINPIRCLVAHYLTHYLLVLCVKGELLFASPLA